MYFALRILDKTSCSSFHALAGFISGLQMLLPANAKRKDVREYEEVVIPKNEPAPLSVGNTRVQVSDLDEVNL